MPASRLGERVLSFLRRVLPPMIARLGMASVCCLLACPPCHAGPECGQSRPWIAVHFLEASWPDRFREAVVADLGASLGERRIDVCPAQTRSPSPPRARITFSVPTRAVVNITVVATDELATKQVSRDVSLATVPVDGHAFAIALATDELISASWEELALPTPEPAAQPPPPPSAARPEIPPELPPSANVGVGLFAVVDLFLDPGQRYAGAKLQVRRALGATFGEQALSLEGAVGAAQGQDAGIQGGTLGHVETRALFGAVWLRAALWHTEAWRLGAAGGARIGYHSFSGVPSATARREGFTGAAAGGVVLSGDLKVDAAVEVAGPLYATIELDLGLPVVNFEALDDQNQRLAAAAGVRWTPSAGLTLEW